MKPAEGAHVGVLVPAESEVLVLDPADEFRLVVRTVADTAEGEQAGDHRYEQRGRSRQARAEGDIGRPRYPGAQVRGFGSGQRDPGDIENVLTWDQAVGRRDDALLGTGVQDQAVRRLDPDPCPLLRRAGNHASAVHVGRIAHDAHAAGGGCGYGPVHWYTTWRVPRRPRNPCGPCGLGGPCGPPDRQSRRILGGMHACNHDSFIRPRRRSRKAGPSASSTRA